jgi:pilus assembly protein CpaB
MNKRFVAVLIFAFIVATGASLTLYRLTSNHAQPARAAGPTVKLVLASRDLELGTILRDGDIVLTDWPGEVPIGTSSHTQDYVGRGVITKIYAKEPIVESRLAPKGAGGGFAITIPQGMRAVAVPVNEVVGVAGFVVPGMHVDVLISGTPPSGSGGLGTLTKTLLQNIEVLSAGQDFKKDAEGKPIAVQVVNLLVTPEQAEQLSLASHQTTIQLVLRNPLDREVTKTSGAALAQLFGGGGKLKPVEAPVALSARLRPHPPAKPVAPEVVVATPAPPPPPKKEDPIVVEIISSGKKAETKFESRGEGK